MHRETVLLHGGRDLGTGVHSPAARLDDGGSTDDLGRRLAALDGTDAAVVLASGMAATTCTLLALLGSGDHLVASRWLPGRVRRFLQEELAAQGIDVTFVDPTDARGWRRAVRQTTRVLFLESPADPSTRVIDLQPTSALAQEHGIALVIDSTFASPINFRPTEHGADVVIHASTTLLSGSADAVGGVVCGSESLVDEVRRKMAIWGPLPDPAGLALLARGLTTLAVRVRRMEENAMQLAEWASAHQAITAVHYPGLVTHADHETARATLDGYGGMLAIELLGGPDAATRMIARLQLVAHATTAGSVASSACEARESSHAPWSSEPWSGEPSSGEPRAAVGVQDGLVRLSVGLEHVDDLIADLAQALES